MKNNEKTMISQQYKCRKCGMLFGFRWSRPYSLSFVLELLLESEKIELAPARSSQLAGITRLRPSASRPMRGQLR